MLNIKAHNIFYDIVLEKQTGQEAMCKQSLSSVAHWLMGGNGLRC